MEAKDQNEQCWQPMTVAWKQSTCDAQTTTGTQNGEFNTSMEEESLPPKMKDIIPQVYVHA